MRTKGDGKLAKIVLITGGNAGIGKATAQLVAAQGANLILACRNRETARQAREEIQKATGSEQVEIMSLDLSSFDSIRQFAEEFRARYDALDVLINNAGVYPSRIQKTSEGFEAQFGVNYLGHFLLTNLLLEQLQKSPAARVVHVSSMMHWLGRIDFSNFRGEKPYRAFPAYAQSKLANILFSNELARRMEGTSVCSNALHPGAVVTSLYDSMPDFALKQMKRFLDSPEEGSQSSVFLGLSPKAEGLTGGYYVKCHRRAMAPKARNKKLAARLWEESKRLCGLV